MRLGRFVRNAARPRVASRAVAVSSVGLTSSLSLRTAVIGGAVATAGATWLLTSAAEDKQRVDYKKVEDDLRKLIESAGSYDDGSYGPLFVRLAWHSAGNYSKYDRTGGTNGASMRFAPESAHGGNAGLQLARGLLEDIKKKHPGISYGDLYTLAGTVAIHAMQGPRACWRPGRVDYASEKTFTATPDGRLPDASQGADHLRTIFYRMGFTDQEIVALSGAHVLGRCHKDRSGFEGPWSNSPTMFSNDYFRLLLDEKWTVRQWNGPKQYQDKSGKLMMLPSDLALLDDAAFRHWVEHYAQNEEAFFEDFSRAWTKLMELGVQRNKSVWDKLF